MVFLDTLVPGRLVQRYKRFLADVTLEDSGDVVTAHCANPGSMMGLKEPGSEVWLSPARDPNRKLRWTLELVKAPATGALVGVNTALPNRLVEEALDRGVIPELAGYAACRREVRYGERSRIDLLLESPGRPDCYVEIKSVTLARPKLHCGVAEFPDAVTARGARHLDELAAMRARGDRAVLLYIVQRGDCDRLRVAADIDPVYAAAFETACAAGVEAIAYVCDVSTRGITVARPLPLIGERATYID